MVPIAARTRTLLHLPETVLKHKDRPSNGTTTAGMVASRRRAGMVKRNPGTARRNSGMVVKGVVASRRNPGTARRNRGTTIPTAAMVVTRRRAGVTKTSKVVTSLLLLKRVIAETLVVATATLGLMTIFRFN